MRALLIAILLLALGGCATAPGLGTPHKMSKQEQDKWLSGKDAPRGKSAQPKAVR